MVQALHKALNATLGDPEVRTQLEKVGGMLAPVRSQAEVDREYAVQTERFRGMARAIKLEAQ